MKKLFSVKIMKRYSFCKKKKKTREKHNNLSNPEKKRHLITCDILPYFFQLKRVVFFLTDNYLFIKQCKTESIARHPFHIKGNYLKKFV